MKSFVPFLPLLAALAVPAALPKVVHPMPKQWVALARNPSTLQINIMTAEEALLFAPFALITNADKLSVNFGRAHRYLYEHCLPEHSDGDGCSCSAALIIVKMSEQDYKEMP